ncbi:hypothetical protein K388_07369 [Streptomyces sp. KhCrAH-43]|uniref:DUF6197 family protein n=1 Tax=unclassified Streptomyces TaxID=2593676 RepID=UPI0003A824D4|nr:MULTISPECIES: hypothetical protein [unclassified Streptomyces]RAJ44929.1 hypothetical protein K388_07369 [Streptomyces sp. KhCrAH-43]
MNTRTETTTDFTPIDPDLYATAFQLLDPHPDPTPAPDPAAATPKLLAQVTASLPAAPPVRLTGPVEKALTDALDFLDTHGWARRTLIHPEGARCSIGALRVAAGARNAAYRDAGNLLLDEARRQHGKKWESIPSWNDSHTGAQVRSVWEAAIRRAHHLNI